MSVYTYGAILVLSLGAAWYQWTKPAETISGAEVVLLYGEETTIEGISWDSEKDSVTIEMKKDEQGSYLWATYTDKKKEEDATKQFKVGKDGEKLLTSLSPLVAIRSLTNLTPEKLEELGLKEAKSSMSVTRKGKTTTFDIGNEAYGTKDLYVRNQETQEVFLLDDAKIRSLKFARTRLPDRKLWSFEKTKITGMTIHTSISEQSQSLVLENKNWQDKKQSKWIKQSQPEADNTQITNWVTKFLRSTNSSYALNIKVADLTEAFSVDITADGSSAEKLTIYHDAEKKNWYADTTHSRGMVKLIKQSITGLSDDLPSLFSTNTEEPKETTPQPETTTPEKK